MVMSEMGRIASDEFAGALYAHHTTTTHRALRGDTVTEEREGAR